MNEDNAFKLSELIVRMGVFYKTPVNELAMRAYISVMQPFPVERCADAICALMEKSVFMPKPCEIRQWLEDHTPGYESDSAGAVRQFRSFLTSIDSGSDYIFDDVLIPFAIRDAFGSLVQLTTTRLDDEACVAKFRDAYEAQLMHHDFTRDNEFSHVLEGRYHGRDPIYRFVGDYEVCRAIAKKVDPYSGRLPSPPMEPEPTNVLPLQKEQYIPREKLDELIGDLVNRLRAL